MDLNRNKKFRDTLIFTVQTPKRMYKCIGANEMMPKTFCCIIPDKKNEKKEACK